MTNQNEIPEPELDWEGLGMIPSKAEQDRRATAAALAADYEQIAATMPEETNVATEIPHPAVVAAEHFTAEVQAIETLKRIERLMGTLSIQMERMATAVESATTAYLAMTGAQTPAPRPPAATVAPSAPQTAPRQVPWGLPSNGGAVVQSPAPEPNPTPPGVAAWLCPVHNTPARWVSGNRKADKVPYAFYACTTARCNEKPPRSLY